jgi:Tfp pilus assembly protein FimT
MKHIRSQSGITLMELLTVVVITGIVAAMALPNFGHTLDKLRFRTAARDIVSKLRLARSEAIANKAPFGISFDDTHRTMTIFEDVEDPGAAEFGSGDSVVSVDTLPDDFNYLTGTFGSNAIVYQPNGSASVSGTLIFMALNEAADYVNFGSIDVLASTGRIRLNDLHYY